MISADDLRAIDLFDGLTDDQLASLAADGEEQEIEPGVVLFHAGEPAVEWWVVLEGAVDLLQLVGAEETVVGRMDVPGRWAGGLRAWDEEGVYLATGRGVAPGRVFRLPSEALRARTTEWFPLGGHLITGLYRTARAVESRARQRDSMATLGTLAAGFAHEINNPAAAAGRAAQALDAACQTLLASLGRLAEGHISARQFRELDALRRQVLPRTGVVDALDLADNEDALSSWAARRGVDDAWAIAPPLAAAGVDVAWCVRAEAVLGAEALGPGLEWAASTFSVAALLGEVKESTRRISELVGAVGSYSQLDRASLQRVAVTEGIESTLVMLSHKLKSGVEVVRRYGEVPRVEAYAGELNQVWTNLFDNAIDAMEGHGVLRIVTRAEEDMVVVEIGDTGAGMPPEVVARAFDAFYTTKEVGKGTGLGLDIARRIVVVRHGGSIDITSEPGDTVLTVRIPVQHRGQSDPRE